MLELPWFRRRSFSGANAASGLMNLSMVPMWILSGVFFSSQRFPDLVQPVIKALPLTALIACADTLQLPADGSFVRISPHATDLRPGR